MRIGDVIVYHVKDILRVAFPACEVDVIWTADDRLDVTVLDQSGNDLPEQQVYEALRSAATEAENNKLSDQEKWRALARGLEVYEFTQMKKFSEARKGTRR